MSFLTSSSNEGQTQVAPKHPSARCAILSAHCHHPPSHSPSNYDHSYVRASGRAHPPPYPPPQDPLLAARCGGLETRSSRCGRVRGRCMHHCHPLLAARCSGLETHSPRCGRVRGCAGSIHFLLPDAAAGRHALLDAGECVDVACTTTIHSLLPDAAAWRRTLLDAGECVDVR
ncbi:hypothetical protein DFP72DRAFT_872439, partial [Ephemerocybe angulata]